MEIIWQPKARRQVDEIGLYIAENSSEQADRVCDMIEHAPEVLCIHPEFGAVVPELGDEFRELRVYHYRIIYRIAEEEIRIVIVVHVSRQLTGDMVG